MLLVSASVGCGGSASPPTKMPAPDDTEEQVVEPTERPEPPRADETTPPSEEPSEPVPPPEGAEPEEPEEPEPVAEATVKDDLERCAPAQEKLIEIGRLVDASIADHMERKKKGWVAKCKRRVEEGDAEFIEDLRCVADSDDFDGLIRCDGWTDWPAM